MPFAIDFRDETTLAWTTTPDGATCETITDYTPSIYVQAVDGSLAAIEAVLAADPRVVDTGVEEWRPGFRAEPEALLRVDLAGVDAVRPVAWSVRDRGAPGAYRCYNVDLSPEFRFCLERDRSPVPAGPLATLTLSCGPLELREAPLTELTVDGDAVAGSPDDVLDAVEAALAATDPDVLVLNDSTIVPRLFETAAAVDRSVAVGRRPGYTQLAGASSYESYGRVGHSPARYNVPGRAIVDCSNTFVYHQSNLHGCLDLVKRSGKPLQELAWASIGNILTAIQIREARDRGVLAPWRSWRHEFFKPMATLHDADRGGYTFAPDVGLHADVHELDFSSLYPNIIRTRNVSPERIRCDCHDTADVPGLGYSICERDGYLPEVLAPLIDDRAGYKAELQETDDPDERAVLEGKSDAIKWILVSCFGYQGFSNAKFGRIECHEAINAFAREILLDAKETLEANGWRVVHGIVDSLWVTAREGAEQAPLDDLAATITDDAEIALEYEAAYDWIAFCPQRESDAGALTKYFGAVADADGEYKFRGIECRQRSTTAFVAAAQRELIETFDEALVVEGVDREAAVHRVCDRLRHQLHTLRSGTVDPQELAIRNRTSKRADVYEQYTRTVAALERAADHRLERSPGQDVEYVVVDDDRESRERVALACESPDTYDPDFYADRLLRAADSVLAPLGWRREAIEAELASRQDADLRRYATP